MISARFHYYLALAFILAGVGHAQGETITTVSVFDFSSEFPVFGRVANNTVNGSGIVGDLHQATDGPGMWHTEFGDFVPGSNNFAHITFDLGASYDIDEIKIWNYGETHGGGTGFTRRGVSNLRISTASTDVSPTFTTVGDFTLSRAPVFRNSAGEYLFGSESLSVAAQNIRLVRFDILGSHWNRDDDVVGLSEVAFNGNITAVPEPSAFVLLGLGTLAFGLRRRNRSS